MYVTHLPTEALSATFAEFSVISLREMAKIFFPFCLLKKKMLKFIFSAVSVQYISIHIAIPAVLTSSREHVLLCTIRLVSFVIV